MSLLFLYRLLNFSYMVSLWHKHIVYIIIPSYLLLFLICYSLSCHLYILLHFLMFVTLHVVTCDPCTCIPCIVNILLYVYLAYFILYMHNTVVWVYYMLHICMFSSITHHYTTYLLYQTRDYRGHDPMITY